MYTKTPTSDTYSQEDIIVTREWTSRQGDPTGLKDEQFLNVIIETVKARDLEDSRHFVLKRAGSSILFTPSVSGEVRGAYFWPDWKYVVYCISNDVYLYKLSDGSTITCNNVFGTTSGDVGFTSFLYDNGTISIIATDGTTLISITNAGVVTTCADADLPAPHIPKPIFIDGYLCLVKSSTASIYNSDLNDPMAWTAGNVIDAEMDGDQLVTIDKINNYIVAFGSTSIEYFWDAGVDTGSPFQRNETPIKINQYVGGLAKYGNSLYYIGIAEGSQLDVFKLQDFQIEPIGTPTITRYLSSLTDAFSTYTGAIVSCLGHTFYAVVANGRTFVCDVDTKRWVRWAFQSGTSFNISNAVQINSGSYAVTLFTIGTSEIFYKLNDSVYQDNGTNFTATIITEPADFGTLNRKAMSKLAFIADRPSANSFLSVSWSDDDFQSFTTPVTVNLNQDLPNITRLGSFRQRAIKLTYTDNYPFRIQRMEANINKGRN